MKTTYQKLHKYGLNSLVFGKSKKKDYVLLWMMIALIFLLGIIL